ncbi:MAG: LPS export ABC transporter ATP-binding protein [Hyphomicrobiaceae bacterium]|nr:LPS export ABC transporter ATP-binding protein [Hyphomicrobiaceae bacterium]
MKLFPFGWGSQKPAKPQSRGGRSDRSQPPALSQPPSLAHQLRQLQDDWDPGPPPKRFGEPQQARGHEPFDPYEEQRQNGYYHPGQPAPFEQASRPHEEPHAGHNWLTAENIKKSYGTRQVVKGVSLATGRGEAVGLLGPNGAGKTTTFYMITGLVAVDSGRITLDGRDVSRLPMYRRARLGIGYLPQEASIFRGLTVEQNIMAVLELVEPKRRKRKEQLDSLLEEFNITRLRKSPSLALSGGERRRCEIARALATRPSFMLLDEPFAGIDPLAVGDIQQLVRQLTARGIGVLITDHNVRETLSLVDRAYIIYDGQVLTHGNPQEIISNEDVRRVYLGDMFG